MNKQILDFLKKQGLAPEMEDGNIVFKYQMRSFKVYREKDDERFLNIAMPFIYDVDKNNYYDVLAALDKVNQGTKLVKLYISNDGVYVGAEQFLDSDPNFDEIIPRTLDLIMTGRERFYEELKKL